MAPDEILATLKHRTQAESETFDENVTQITSLTAKKTIMCLKYGVCFFGGSEVE
jgi:hypothetical protein